MSPSPATYKFGKIPKHVAIIMDGNGRWAKSKNMIRVAGPSRRRGIGARRGQGRRRIRRKIPDALRLFRRELETAQDGNPAPLMNLLEKFLRDELPRVDEKQRAAPGHRPSLPICPTTVREPACTNASRPRAKTPGLSVILALSYSGRVEIIEAVHSIIREIKLGHLDSAQSRRPGLQSPSLHALLSRPRPAHPHQRRNAPE